jgi:DNA-binding NtrC family response regulator
LEDVPLLIRHFTDHGSTSTGTARTLSKAALACLMTYDWPGNVRELENVMRRAVAMSQTESILPQDLPENVNTTASAIRPAEGNSASVTEDSLEAYELAAIRNALQKNDGNRKKAALMLGIGEATLYRKLKKYNL